MKNSIKQSHSSRFLFAALIAGAAAHNGAMAQGFDHRLPYDNSRIYKLQDAVPLALGVISVGGALYEGSETRLGNTLWQSSEAMLFSGVLAGGIKMATRRQRPTKTDNPNQWFSDSGNDSFPSGHVTLTAAAVTPMIMAYKGDHPWVWALALLPAYEMVARVKTQQHWQSDVVVGAALGAAVGMYEYGHEKPWMVSLIPGGVFVGYHANLKN